MNIILVTFYCEQKACVVVNASQGHCEIDPTNRPTQPTSKPDENQIGNTNGIFCFVYSEIL